MTKEKDGKSKAPAACENAQSAPENPESVQTGGEELSEKIKELQTKAEELEAQKKQEHELLLRTAAEYDNYRKRTSDEMSRKRADGKAEAVEKFLTVADSIKMALSVADDENDPVHKGIKLIAKQLSDTLAALGVTEIPTDIPFDPNLHNAVMHVEDEAKGEGEIVEVFAAGYRMGDRVLRHSMVKVAN